MFGAKLIEKHFTYRIEGQEFHDHKISADLKMMKNLVDEIRNLEEYLGDENKNISRREIIKSICEDHLRQKKT